MEKSSLEHEPATPLQEPEFDPQRTLEIIEALGRDLDALRSDPPQRGFLKFIRQRLFRGAKN